MSVVSLSAQRVSLNSLLNEMIDRDAIANFPSPYYTTAQASSYDRASVAKDQPGWFANWDRTQFIRVEYNDGRREYVMMDEEGPGAIVRFWMTFAGNNCGKGTLRIYIDDRLVVEGTAFDILSGGQLVGAPLSESVSKLTKYENRGHDLYLPIPYAKHCKVTYQTDNVQPDQMGAHDDRKTECVYYNINYRTYDRSVDVVSFSTKELKNSVKIIDRVQKALTRKSVDRKAGKSKSVEMDLAPSAEQSLLVEGCNAIGHLCVSIDADNINQALRSTILKIEFDGQQTVWVPVGDFFAIGYKRLYSSMWYCNSTDKGEMNSYWVMPFRRSCRLSLVNLGSQPVKATLGVDYSPWKWSERSMYFGSSWLQYTAVDTGGVTDMSGENCGIKDINFTRLKGEGVYVGDAITLFNCNYGWWGEGDEKIYIDGEDFPSHFGTGTEDYYGYAWCRPEVFTDHPFIAQPAGDGSFGPGYTHNTRFRSLDAIPFRSSLVFDMELWHWARCKMNYAPTTYWYIRPGGECEVKEDMVGAKAKVAISRKDIVPNDIRLTIEAENLVPTDFGGGNFTYQLSKSTQYSGGYQILWINAKQNARLSLEFESSFEGKFGVETLWTVAPTYGTVQLYVNDQPVGGSACLTGNEGAQLRSNGTCTLVKGTNRLSVEMVSIPDGCSLGSCGLDKVVFIP